MNDRLRRRFLSGAALLFLSAMGLSACGGGSTNSGGSSAPKQLTVTEAGGTYGNFVKKSIIAPFEQSTGTKVTAVTGLTLQNLAKLRASKGNPELDVATFDPPGAFPAVQEGLLEKLDPKKIPNLSKMHDWGMAKDGYLVATLASNQCLAYNTEHIKTPPTSWEDLWKPEYKGKVIMPDISTSHGTYVVSIMSKIATGDLYNADGAFAKLKTLKPNILNYWTSHDQVAQLLNSGEAWITPWTADRAATQFAQKAPIDCVVPKEGAVFFVSYMGVAKGTKNLEVAFQYVNAVIDAKSQTAAANEIFLGPTNKEVKLEGLPLKYLDPSRPSLVRPDWDKLMTLQSDWADRWNREMK